MAARDTLDLAEQLIDLRRFDHAVDLLLRSMHGGPEDAEAHFLLGVAHQEAGRPEAALAAVRTAVGLAPDDDQNHKLLANVLVQLGRHAEAAEAARAALRLDPTDPQSHYLLGVALAEQRGHAEEAFAAFEHAARLAPETVEVHVAMGCLATRAQQYDRAEACFQQALALDPAHEWTLANIATLRQRRGEDAAAVDWLLRSAAVHPTGPGGRGLADVGQTLLARLTTGLALVALALGAATALSDGAWPALTLAVGLVLVGWWAWRPLRRVARIPGPVRAELLWHRRPARAGLVLAGAGAACLTAAVALSPWAPPLWAGGTLLAVAAAGATVLRRRRAID